MDYVISILINVCIYVLLAASYELIAGQTGVLSLAHGAFFGLGAYASALLSVHHGTSFLLGTTLAAAIGGVGSLGISLPSVRLRGDYAVLLTLGFQLMCSSVFTNWIALTGGPLGVSDIPTPALFGRTLDSQASLLGLALCFAVAGCVIVHRLVSSPMGRVLRAIREDEVFAQAAGKRPATFKVIVMAVAGALAASAGSFYAHYMGYIDPSSFGLSQSVLILSMVIIGGAGNLLGAVVGALLLSVLPECLRFIGLPVPLLGNIQQIVYGAVLVVMMFLRPRGLLGRYGFG